jgi:hypothetical protein
MSDCSGNVCNLINNYETSKCCKQQEPVRLYTQEECRNINGIWHANGECTKKEGGSYSWDNRKQLGKPCPECPIRLYTKEECDTLGGNWYPNGECLKKTGGSFSWDNRPNKTRSDEYNVQVSLTDSNLEYKSAKSVTVRDVSGNILFSTEPDTRV